MDSDDLATSGLGHRRRGGGLRAIHDGSAAQASANRSRGITDGPRARSASFPHTDRYLVRGRGCDKSGVATGSRVTASAPDHQRFAARHYSDAGTGLTGLS